MRRRRPNGRRGAIGNSPKSCVPVKSRNSGEEEAASTELVYLWASMAGPVSNTPLHLGADATRSLQRAVLDCSPVSGLTHRYYRYPARFSPRFAATAMELFSKKGDLVLDPFMGGGTTIVEGVALNRQLVGTDLNTLSVFLTRVKTTRLLPGDRVALASWADHVLPSLSYSSTPQDLQHFVCSERTRNLTAARCRPIKKLLALALRSLQGLPSGRARDFARCALLNVSQLALDGRRRATPLPDFRKSLQEAVHAMLSSMKEFEIKSGSHRPVLLNCSAADLPTQQPFLSGRLASLVVTSPPYPGVHVLYHRWQVDGRRETPAPYWLAGCEDGCGASHYTFGDRRANPRSYFTKSLETLKGIRAAMRSGGMMVQLVAFSDPPRQLPLYLENMQSASFGEVTLSTRARLWRDVPSRRWHAHLKGRLPSSREVVLIHEAT